MSSSEVPKSPTRLDSQETRVEIAEEYVAEERVASPTDSRAPRFSFNQASRPDIPFNRRPAEDRLPNLKGASPIPGSQPEQVRDKLYSNSFFAKVTTSLAKGPGDAVILTDIECRGMVLRGRNATS